jgi:signal transduction histidine kinase
MTKRIPVHLEHHYFQKDAYDVWLDINAYPTEEGLAVYYHDITHRKKAEENLKKSQAALAEAQSIAHLGSWDISFETRTYSWSDEMYILTDFDPEAGVPSLDDLSQKVSEEDRNKLKELHKNAAEKGIQGAATMRILQPDGSHKWFEARVKPVFNSDGKIMALAGTLLDISDQKQIEEKLEDRVKARTRELAIEKERAEAADRVKSAFLATMSHELRTPLNSIIGFTGILLQGHPGPLNPEQQKQLGMVQRSAWHLLDLINDVLDISKIEAGELELHYTEVNLLDVLSQILELISPMAQKKNLDIQLSAPDKNLQIQTDERRVKQIILNIVNNAIKFTESGNVHLELSTSKNEVMIAIKDTGIGISADEIEGIFKPFNQIDNTLTRNHEGTGLGLSISIKLARMLGGDIKVESEPGIGSLFTLVLPIHSSKI